MTIRRNFNWRGGQLRFRRRFCAILIRTSDWITDGLGLDDGPSVGTDDSPGIADGREDKLDKRGAPANAGVAPRSARARTLVNYVHDGTAHMEQMLDRGSTVSDVAAG